MNPLYLTVMIFALNAAQPQSIVEPGPPTGIVLQDAPGILVTDCQVHTQRIFVRLDPYDVYKKHISTERVMSGRATQWTESTIEHAQLETIHMLSQLQKLTSATSALGLLFSIGTSAVNAIRISTLRKHVEGLKKEMPEIKKKLDLQQRQLQNLGTTLEGTILAVNQHRPTAFLNYTIYSVGKMSGLDVIQQDYAHVQMVNTLMQDLLREVSSAVVKLADNRIPLYLVPMELVESILRRATQGTTQAQQVYLAYSLGSAIPIHVDPEGSEIGFLLNIPIFDARNIYQLKSVINVGFWTKDMHVKMETPSLIAYQDENPDMYLIPNLQMCTAVKDIHWLCPSKPFILDPTEGLCGIKQLSPNYKCKAVITHRKDVTITTIERVENKWLVNTPVGEAMIIYDRYYSTTPIHLPNQTMLIQVPKGAIFHIDHLALYHLDNEGYDVEIEIVDAFNGQTLEVDRLLQDQIMSEGPKLTELSHQLHSFHAKPIESNSKTAALTWGWNISDSILLIFNLSSWITIVPLMVLLYWQVHTVEANLLGQNIPRPAETLELKPNTCRPLPQLPPITPCNIDYLD